MEKVLKGSLSASPRFIPTWYRYDEIGSALNDDCFLNPDYYMHGAEQDILKTHINKCLETYHDSDVCLIDIGCGSCLKSRKVLDGLLEVKARVTFIPIDISKDFLYETVRKLKEEYAGKIIIDPIADSYIEAFKILKSDYSFTRKLFLWFGGIQSETMDDQKLYLSKLVSTMTGYSKYLIMNGLERLQRDFGAKLDRKALLYECEFVVNLEPWNQSYFRAWVRALKDTHIFTGIDNLTIKLQKGERIYLHQGEGISHKYSIEQLEWLGKSSGLKMNYYVKDANLHVALTSFKKL